MATSVCDFALWGGLVPGNADRLEELAELGVVGFKAFMCPSGIDDFEAADDATLREGMAIAAELGLPVAVHAESPAMLLEPAGTGWHDWARSRPREAEHDAIEKALGFAEETGCSLHVVHVSTGRGVRLVEEAQERGIDATCETCPHYLFLDEDDAERLGAVAKCAPPLRPAAERDALWAALDDIAFVASDHSPAPPELKAADDFFAIWGGIAGVQALLGVLLDAGHHERGVALERIAEIGAAGAARRLGLAGKGRIEPGCDADLAIVDLAGATDVTRDSLLSRHRLSPYLGRTLRGRIVRTVVRGTTVVAEGRVVAPSPAGRLVTPSPSEEREP
jgi:allantoinase